MIKTLFSIAVTWEGQPWLLVPLIVVGVIFVVWSYRRTVPRISPSLRILLTTMRALVVCFILLLFFKPVAVLEDHKLRPPDLGILVDVSASMGIDDKEANRSDLVLKLLNDDRMSDLGECFNLRHFLFSDSLMEALDWRRDSLEFSGTATDIAGSLEAAGNLLDSRSGALLLVTDGAYNLGSEPSRSAGRSPVPIFVLGVGDSIPPKDLGIAEIKVDPLVYLGDRVSLEATLLGFSGAETILKLIGSDGRVIASEKVVFHPGEGEKQAQLQFTPKEVGSRVYLLSLEGMEEETALDNNRRHFALKVLPSRIDILLIAGAPSADFAFLKRILERNSDINLTSRVERGDGGFYHPSGWDGFDDFDLIIMLNYPTAGSDRQFVNNVVSAVMGGKPAAIIPGCSFEGSLLKPLKNLLPADFGRRLKEDVPVKLEPESEVSPLTDFFPPGYDWNEAPPVRRFPGLVRMRETAVISARVDDGEPAVGYSIAGGTKTLTLTVHDLWRLSLQDPAHSAGDSLIAGFWQNAVRWLATREEEELFRLSTGGEKIFTSGARIPFTARVYDRSYRPLSGMDVSVEISGPEGQLSVNLKSSGMGEYTGDVRFFSEGAYTYAGRAASGGDTLFAKGEFTVEAFNPEFLDPAMRPDLLRNIAQAGGGKFYLPDEFDGFLKDYNPQMVEYIDKREIKIFPRWFSMIVLFALLTVEWTVRKRKGML